MRHLIVYANPRPRSFCRAILETTVAALQEEGHEVMVRDLYAMGFEPVLGMRELQETASGAPPPEIRAEQFFIRAAEVLTFIYPVWWTGMPAIMKGYFDRVFSYNFAYAMLRHAPAGLLKGKQVVLFSTQRSPGETYRDSGMFDAMKKVTDEGIFSLAGMEVVEHTFFAGVDSADDLARESMLGRVRDAMQRYAIAPSVP